jgi:hypothetical protein
MVIYNFLALFLGIKQQEYEVDPSPPSSAKNKSV